MNPTGPYWWQVNIGSGDGLVPSDKKPLPELMLAQFSCHAFEWSLDPVFKIVSDRRRRIDKKWPGLIITFHELVTYFHGLPDNSFHWADHTARLIPSGKTSCLIFRHPRASGQHLLQDWDNSKIWELVTGNTVIWTKWFIFGLVNINKFLILTSYS